MLFQSLLLSLETFNNTSFHISRFHITCYDILSTCFISLNCVARQKYLFVQYLTEIAFFSDEVLRPLESVCPKLERSISLDAL